MKLDKNLIIERQSLNAYFPAGLPATEFNSSDVIGNWNLIKSIIDKSVDGRVIDECCKIFRNTFK